MGNILKICWGCLISIISACSFAGTQAGHRTLDFQISGNYLLLPVNDSDPESLIQLSVNGDKVGEPMYIRVPRTKISYWIPIDVSAYKGQTVSLIFDHIDKANTGYAKIKQSDTFEFDYDESYRPVYHVSPEHGWMNDPNGMVYYDGGYHLFYQYNPYGSRWANMHWGHVVSQDLVNWEHLPVALAPDPIGAIFSGSAVIDKDNTAGFGKDVLIAVYTSAGKIQAQSIAYSSDKGRTFTKYGHNPVLSDPVRPDFRDPKVFRHPESGNWIMTLATGQTISFYASEDLKSWDKLSEFGEGMGAHGGVWECPDLFPLKYKGKTKWVLLVSINPGGPNGGSATQYFIGDFDGKTFTADPLPYPLWLDYGRDNYAGVTWSNIPESDGRTLFMGWMNNWDYANLIPPLNFRGAMTLPRELVLRNNGKHLVVANAPAREVTGLQGKIVSFGAIGVERSYTIQSLLQNNQGAYEIEMEIRPGKSSVFGFALSNRKGEKIDFRFDLSGNLFAVDRSKSGIVDFSPDFASKISKAPLVGKDCYHIRLFVDKSSTECFINHGELVQTNSVFPTESYNTLSFEADSGMSIENLNVYSLKK